MKFTLSIKLGNDAMSTCGDLALAIRNVASSIAREHDTQATPSSSVRGLVIDTNGNKVGSWKVQ